MQNYQITYFEYFEFNITLNLDSTNLIIWALSPLFSLLKNCFYQITKLNLILDLAIAIINWISKINFHKYVNMKKIFQTSFIVFMRI